MGKILILSNSAVGLYKFRNELLLKLLQENEVYVSVPYDDTSELIQNEGCKVIDTLINRRGINVLEDFRLLMFYIKLIIKVKPDVILTYTIKPNVYGGFASRIMGYPYIVNITGLGTAIHSDTLLSKIILFLYKQSCKKSSCIFFQNRENLDFFEQKKCIRTKSRLISGSGVNLNEYMPQPFPAESEAVHILNITRIMKDKGIEELLGAAQLINQEFPEVVFDILGIYEEETRDKYESLIEDLQKKCIIKYHGFQNDIHPFLKKSRLIVHPTYHEGMSNVLLEAAASGRPVVASNISGCKETFVDGISGISCEPQNTQSLYEAIKIFLLKNYEEQKQMAYMARKHIEKNFDREDIVKAYLEEINIAKNEMRIK